jgi:hypothetical protein
MRFIGATITVIPAECLVRLALQPNKHTKSEGMSLLASPQILSGGTRTRNAIRVLITYFADQGKVPAFYVVCDLKYADGYFRSTL